MTDGEALTRPEDQPCYRCGHLVPVPMALFAFEHHRCASLVATVSRLRRCAALRTGMRRAEVEDADRFAGDLPDRGEYARRGQGHVGRVDGDGIYEVGDHDHDPEGAAGDLI